MVHSGCEPSALYCWILEILYCTPKGCRALLRTPSTEGRSVCLCWAPSKPKGPKGNAGGLDPRDLKTALLFGSFLRKGEVLAYVGRIHNLKDLKDSLSPPPALRAEKLAIFDPLDSCWRSRRNLATSGTNQGSRQSGFAPALRAGGTIRKEAWPFYRTISGVRL